MGATTRKSLIQDACEGGSDSWRELARMYSPLIRAKLSEARLPHDDVEDLTQEILLKLHRKMSGFNHNGRAGAFRRWLRVVTVNQTRSYLRRRPEIGQVSLDEIEPLADDNSEVSEQFERQHHAYVLAELIERLRDEFQENTVESFVRATINQEDPRQVCESLGISLQALYIAKSRVLKRLRELAVDYEVIL